MRDRRVRVLSWNRRGNSRTGSERWGYGDVPLPDEEHSFTAQPCTAAPDDLTFEVVTDGGVRTPLTFEETDGGVDMFFQRWRLEPA